MAIAALGYGTIGALGRVSFLLNGEAVDTMRVM
jgi:hypothetical protein